MQSSSSALPFLAKHPLYGVEPGAVARCFVIAALDPLKKRGMDVEPILQQAGVSHLQVGTASSPGSGICRFRGPSQWNTDARGQLCL